MSDFSKYFPGYGLAPSEIVFLSSGPFANALRSLHPIEGTVRPRDWRTVLMDAISLVPSKWLFDMLATAFIANEKLSALDFKLFERDRRDIISSWKETRFRVSSTGEKVSWPKRTLESRILQHTNTEQEIGKILSDLVEEYVAEQRYSAGGPWQVVEHLVRTALLERRIIQKVEFWTLYIYPRTRYDLLRRGESLMAQKPLKITRQLLADYRDTHSRKFGAMKEDIYRGMQDPDADAMIDP